MHCLILRGEQRTLIRRLSGDTRLNGATFDDALLRTGDRLGIGALELEVVDEMSLVEAPQHAAAPADPAILENTIAGTSAATAEAFDATLNQAKAELAANLGAVTHQSRRRARLLIHELRSVRKRNHELEQLQTSRTDADQEIDRRWAQLENDIQAFVDQRQRWQEVRAENERLLVWRRGQLEEQSRRAAAELQTLADDRAALEEQQRRVAQQSTELELQRATAHDDRRPEPDAEQLNQAALEQRARELDAQADELAQQAQRLSAAEADSSTSSSVQSAEAAELAALRQQLETQRQSWESQRCEWESQQAAAAAVGEKLNAELQQWESQKAAWEMEHALRCEELEANRVQLQHAQTALAEQQTEVANGQSALAENQAELTKLRATIDAQQAHTEMQRQELQSVESQIAAEQTALADERRTFESQRAARELELQNQAAATTESESQLGRLTDALEHGKAAFAQQQAHCESERIQHENALNLRQAELDRRAGELEAERQQWLLDREQQATLCPPIVAESAAVQPVNVPSPSAAAHNEQPLAPAAVEIESAAQGAATPDHEDEVFARLRALSLLKKDAGDDVGEEAKTDPAATFASTPTNVSESAAECEAATSDEPAEHGERRINRRLHGQALAADARHRRRGRRAHQGNHQSRSPNLRPFAAPPETVASQANPESSVVAKKLLKLEPRKVAPEKSEGLAAMREIANLSARSAIATHHHRRRASRAWSNMIVSLVGLGCGVWLMVRSPEINSPSFYGGLLGLVVSLYWFAKARLLARGVQSFKRHHQQQFAAILREQTAATTKPEEVVAIDRNSEPPKE